MNIFLIRKIKKELQKLNISCRNINIIQNKDGVIVARILYESESYIIKYFEKDEYKREIDNYKILASLDIETISVIGFTDSAILMEDISNSTVFRLGTKADLDNPTIAKAIAKWYRNLHTKGELYVKENGNNLYDQTDYFTLKNIETIKRKTNTENLEVWTLIFQNYDFICNRLKLLPKTLTYNDFYYTNLIIKKDLSSVFMFDYNLLGKSYIYSDIRNVISSLSNESQESFLTEYGDFDKEQILIDDIVSTVITLHFACQKANFPEWGKPALISLQNDLTVKIMKLIQM